VAGYLLEEEVGSGGMATVFRAVDEGLGRRVAVKVLAPALGSDASFRKRFIRESRAAAAVDDPHIVPVYEAGESGGVLFIAMRYVPGHDVGTLLAERGPLPSAQVAAIISQVASALDAAHASGLVHRDVKPANMLLDVHPGRPDHVYLSDFGLAKAALQSAALTAQGEFLGTPSYVAPEQILGRSADGRTDQYALACTAFEMLTGHPPFEREHWMAVILAHQQAEPPKLAALRPGLPHAADSALARALSKAPEGRYRTCTEFAESLRAALGIPPYHSVPDPNLAVPGGPVAWAPPAPISPRLDPVAPGQTMPISGVGIHRMRTRSVMPGGGVARRPLHVILLADCSGSMTGPKIQALNFAIGEMLQHFASFEREQDKSVLIRAIAFADEPRWHIEEPMPAATMRWKALSAIRGGRTNMAPLFRMLAQVLTADQASKGLRPVLVLVTDGLPTDHEADLNGSLQELLAVPAARDALRVAVAIGDNARSDALTRFIGNSNLPVLVAGDVEQIADQLYRVSVWVTRANIRSGSALDREATELGPVIDDVVV
jgi:serine/threonine-protein kinase